MPPETAHRATVRALSFLDVPARFLPNIEGDRGKSHECLGLTFPNRVGLAAGFDKDGECVNALGLLGFGFIEVGTVTPKPQPGNRKPRLFRDTRGRSVVNRLGFPNRGADALAKRLAGRRRVGVCGVNIGKNYRTPLKRASADLPVLLRTAVCARRLRCTQRVVSQYPGFARPATRRPSVADSLDP